MTWHIRISPLNRSQVTAVHVTELLAPALARLVADATADQQAARRRGAANDDDGSSGDRNHTLALVEAWSEQIEVHPRR